ncbi:hypothetical protein [Cellulomonas cellasea]|uniref:Uncharacterized protein n=1 Tax=Cellulomonas cellasea TaxID=43670 RepID=A0A7W4YDA5_9CELL|nr:hypothetical protein [Cellulomonas cellasea]MBB2924341.1 hypothetical protein [Cellulomonas cellasea]
MSEPDETATPPGSAVRFIFEYDGDDVRLVSQQRVDVAVTGFDLHQERALPPGHYVEVRGTDGTPLAAVPVRGELGSSLEVFPEDPGEPITRTEVDRPRGAFTVVLPAADLAQQVAVLRVPPAARPAEGDTGPAPAPSEARARATELATFPVELG